MQAQTGTRRRWLLVSILISGLCAVAAGGASADDFKKSLARVDKALQTNPRSVAKRALLTCRDRRDAATRLYAYGQPARAARSLKYCYSLLGIPAQVEEVDQAAARLDPALVAAEAKRKKRSSAMREYTRSLELKPDLENGLAIYRSCASCHGPEGWGMSGAAVPQLAGQHRQVVIQQLADIRAGSRENQVMRPYASVESIGGSQAVADVAGYIDTLEISIDNGKGPGDQLALGKRLYDENCARCHGSNGEGEAIKRIPRIQAQHFHYLVAQFDQIRRGSRYLGEEEMLTLVNKLDAKQTAAIMDYVSRLEPPADLQAPPGWRNPDFLEPVAGR